MNSKNEVFEYLIDQLRHQVTNNPYKQQCEDLAHEEQSLKNQLRDALALVDELQKELDIANSSIVRLRKEIPKSTGDIGEYIDATEQSGCRKEDTQVAEPWVKWEGGECPVPKDTIVQIRMRDGTGACEPGVAGELRWDHRGWGGDITRYRVVKPECEHDWYFYDKGASMMCKKCGLKK